MKKLVITLISIVALQSCASFNTAISDSQRFMSDVQRVMSYTQRSSQPTRRPIQLNGGLVNRNIFKGNTTSTSSTNGGGTIIMCPGIRPNGGLK